ncbi:hypothetical protein Plhal304r1_c018g0064241 [Plasmopara halstedii]
MNRRHRCDKLSERLRTEVEVSAALWQKKSQVNEKITSQNARTRLESRNTTSLTSLCPPHLKSNLFFFKYFQPIRAQKSNVRKLRVNLPLTVICERSNGKERVLWLRTDASGNVSKEETTSLWRKKLSNELLSGTIPTESDPLLAIRCISRRKNSLESGGSAVLMTKSILEPIISAPCDVPTYFQQFVHCRGSQPSVYRIFWCHETQKCFGINLTTSLTPSETFERMDFDRTVTHLSVSTKNETLQAAMNKAAQLAQVYCVKISPNEKTCARWPKLRGHLIAEGVEATVRIVEHVQIRLPYVRFHAMTVDFIKDMSGKWWLTRVVDFKVSSLDEISIEDDRQDSAVCLSKLVHTKHGTIMKDQPMDLAKSFSQNFTLSHDAMNSRLCFLCGCSCDLPVTLRTQLEALIQNESSDESNANRTIAKKTLFRNEVRMTLTMALETIFLMRQRGVSLLSWEHAVNSVRKVQCDFPTCMLCYQIYQQQCCLENLARELHLVLSPSVVNMNGQKEDDVKVLASYEFDDNFSASPVPKSSHLLMKEQHNARETLQNESNSPPLVLHGEPTDFRSRSGLLVPLRGADIDPTASQLRLLFFFHELQDAGPDLDPSNFYLEYQLGQTITQVQLEGSKRHTPNRWQLCEARMHYACATLDAFSEFCAQKQVLIQFKSRICDDGDESTKMICMAKGNICGYTLLTLQAVYTIGNLMEKSPHESRTDYLLELQMASYGRLMLKLTVGLVVDPVPLSQLRDVVRDLLFVEERPPGGIYWPSASYFHTGLAVPRDWISTLMPSEYTKQSPMLRKWGRRTRKIPECSTPAAIIVPFHPKQSFLRRSSITASGVELHTENMTELTVGEKWLKKAASCGDICEDFNADHKLFDSLSMAMPKSTLSQICLTAKRMISRFVEDTVIVTFPTRVLGVILRNANFTLTRKSHATFQLARRLSLDCLFAEVKPSFFPTLALLGELMLTLLEEQELPTLLDAGALERLLDPFWYFESGFSLIPPTQTNCLPQHRVFWNRAIRRWEATSSGNRIRDQTVGCTDMIYEYELNLLSEIGEFRVQTLALVLCELFEQMESLDSGYIAIAELRSLDRCSDFQKDLRIDLKLDPDAGLRERLKHEDIMNLAELLEQQRRMAIWTLLHSLMNTSVLSAALDNFDQLGLGDLSFQNFCQLAYEALVSQRNLLQALNEKPKQVPHGFCLRHGFTETYAIDSFCIHCAVEYEVFSDLKQASGTNSKSIQPIQRDSDTNAGAVQDSRRVSDECILLGKCTGRDLNMIETRARKSAITRRASAPEIKIRQSVFGSVTGETIKSETNSNSRRQRKDAVASTSQSIDDGAESINQHCTTEGTQLSSRKQDKECKTLDGTTVKEQLLEGTMDSHSARHALKSTRKLKESSRMMCEVKKQVKRKSLTKGSYRVRVKHSRPTSKSLSKLLRTEFCERTQITSANHAIIEKTIQIEQRRKELDRLVLDEIQQVKKRLTKLQDMTLQID